MNPKGKILIIGGHEDRDDNKVEMQDSNRKFLKNEILKLLAQSKNDRIEIVTAASAEPESMRDTYRKTFAEIGYTNFGFLHTFEETPEDHYLQRISKAKTVFFTGGDQNRICKHLNHSAIRNLLHEKYTNEENFIIAGTSAGAMCLPEVIIFEAENGEAIIKDDIELGTGLGLLDNLIVDTHFIHRGRFGRLAHAVLLNQELYGAGLGEDTALLIEEGNKAICKGSGMVLMISGSEIDQTNISTVKKSSPVYAENFKVNILTEDCIVDLNTGQMTVSAQS
ncbi:cyanophycinase [Chryseobacterium chendengshani]|uniref:cyanophycinase n=1 Tax=unclassified Chryseobacterium TaxID=2593645 RepID=UPI001C643784|nr:MULTISPECIES: cyanophycinase [unclassified Chryseobacterium]MBW7676376.1 cyanophycinase [Chryseobacterium sp. LJ756]MBW8523749.1 cyanophycinase [Chryseobacterium sp. LJ668]QYK16693.1 cyanophycinase [Chryseobacterium sp. LJ668]